MSSGDDPRVLLVGAPAAVERAAARLEGDLPVLTAGGLQEALDRLEADPVDCVACAPDLPDGGGADLLAAVRERAPGAALVLLAGAGGDGEDREADLPEGATALELSLSDADPAALAARLRAAAAGDRLPAASPDAKGGGAGDGDDSPGDGAGVEPVEPAYDRLLEASPVGVGLVVGGTIRYANRRLAALFGREPGALVGTSPAELVADDGEELAAALQRLAAGEGDGAADGDAYGAVHEGRRRDGTTFAVEVHAGRIEHRGEPAALLAAVDAAGRRGEVVTALHEASTALVAARDREEIARVAVETARDVLSLPHSAVFLWDDDEGALVPVATTEAARETIGPPPAFERGEGIAGHAFAEGETVVLDDAQRDPRALEGGSDAIRSYCVIPLGDHGVMTVASPEAGAFDDVDVDVASLLAATVEAALERVEREALLRRRERRLQSERDRVSALFENIPEPTVQYAFEGDEPVIEAVNPAFERAFGYEGEEAVGRSVDDLIVPPDRIEEAERLNERVIAGERLDVEVRREAADGRRTFLLRNAPVPGDGDDESVRGYAVYTDITERKERERELQRQNERLEEFAAVVSHDLRGPLNVVLGNAELARETGDLEFLDAIEEAAERMDRLIDGVFALARQGRIVGETEPVELAAAAERAWRTVETPDASLQIESDLRFAADPDRLGALLENLFRNAVEHGGEGVTVGPLDDERGFYVADDGPGIPPDERERAFERGYSTAEEGTGFGLAIVREIAAAHGWEVRATGSEAGGARFEVAGVER